MKKRFLLKQMTCLVLTVLWVSGCAGAPVDADLRPTPILPSPTAATPGEPDSTPQPAAILIPSCQNSGSGLITSRAMDLNLFASDLEGGYWLAKESSDSDTMGVFSDAPLQSGSLRAFKDGRSNIITSQVLIFESIDAAAAAFASPGLVGDFMARVKGSMPEVAPDLDPAYAFGEESILLTGYDQDLGQVRAAIFRKGNAITIVFVVGPAVSDQHAAYIARRLEEKIRPVCFIA